MTYTIPVEVYEDELENLVGKWIQGDEWDSANPLIEGDELDKEYFDADLRYARMDDIIPSLPVKLKITGRVVYVSPLYSSRKVRVLITTWDSNEEPVSFRGWLFLT